MKNIREKVIKKLIRWTIMGTIGGFLFYGIGLLYQGRTKISMFILAFILFVIIDIVNEFFTFEMGLLKQSFIACLCITVSQYLLGLFLNKLMGLNIWDYSEFSFNFQGQICLDFSFLWYFLSGIAIVLDDYLRWILFNEQEPKYFLI